MADYTPQRMGILLENYPGQTETIIAREIELLEQMGYSLRIFILNSTDDVSRRIGLNADIFFEHRSKLPLIAAGLAAIPCLLFSRPRGLVAGAVSFIRLWKNTQDRHRLWKGLFQALHIAGSHISTGKVTSLFSFYSGHAATVALLAARFCRIDFNFNASGMDITRQKGGELLEKLHRSRFVTVQAVYYKNYLQALGDFTTPIYVFYHGIDLELFHFPRRFRNPELPYRFLTISRIDGTQDFATALRGLAALREEGISFLYTVIGDGPDLPALRDLIRVHKVEDCVVIHRNVEQPVLIEEYHRNDVFVFLGMTAANGLMDDIPDVLLESMASGLPVIAARHGAIPELIENEETGILLETGEAQVFVEAAKLLLEDDITRELIIMKARLRVESKYNLSTRIAEFVEICEENDLLA